MKILLNMKMMKAKENLIGQWLIHQEDTNQAFELDLYLLYSIRKTEKEYLFEYRYFLTQASLIVTMLLL